MTMTNSTEPQPVNHNQAATMTGDRHHHRNTTPTITPHPESDNLSHKPPEPSEAQLLDMVRTACRWLRLLSYHTADSRRSEPGFPDVVIVGARGVLFRELKSTRGRVTADQQRWLTALTAAGANADTWRPDDWPVGILTELDGIRGRS
jgi:hypothetical protein